jgi:hypothetical protein
MTKQHSGYLAAVAIVMLAGPAVAQGLCPEGKTLSGECVNPSLAASARQAAVLFAQPQISFTALPILPAEDQNRRYPDGLIPNELRPTVGAGILAGSLPLPPSILDKP